MSYGLIQYGRGMKGESLQGLSQVARNEEQREMTNKGLKQAKRQQETTSAASGAVMGAQMGSAGGPWGMVAGAAIGALAGWSLS